MTDWIKYQLDRINEHAYGEGNVHERMGGIQHCIDQLLEHYKTGTLIHHKNKSKMKKPDELKHFGPGDEEEGTKATQEPAAEVAEATETANADTKG